MGTKEGVLWEEVRRRSARGFIGKQEAINFEPLYPSSTLRLNYSRLSGYLGELFSVRDLCRMCERGVHLQLFWTSGVLQSDITISDVGLVHYKEHKCVCANEKDGASRFEVYFSICKNLYIFSARRLQ